MEIDQGGTLFLENTSLISQQSLKEFGLFISLAGNPGGGVPIDVSQVYLYNGVPTQQEDNLISGWLANLANTQARLPITNPFASQPPFEGDTGENLAVDTVEVFIELGQSPIEGRDGDVGNGAYPFVSTVGAKEYNGTELVPLSTLRGDATRGSHANYFADRYFELTGKKAILVECGAGGSGLGSSSGSGSNNWSATGDRRSEAETKTAGALVAANRPIPYALWSQGERDAQEIDSGTGYTIAEAKAAMLDVIDWWFSLYPDSYFFISQTGRPSSGDTAGFQAIRNMQQEVSDERTRVIMAFKGAVDFPDQGKMYDELNYNFMGNDDMGVAFAESANDTI